MEMDVYNQLGEVVEKVKLPDAVFSVTPNHELIQQVLLAQRANARQVLAHTKDRSEVRGGGRKPWRQKGTGRARHASIRSPIWRGGGITFGPTKDRNFSQKINKKMRRKAMLMALTSKVKDQELLLLDNVSLDTAKTKQALTMFNTLSQHLIGYKKNKLKRDSILMITPTIARNLILATRNLHFAELVTASNINVYDLLKVKYLIITKNALPVIEKTLCR